MDVVEMLVIVNGWLLLLSRGRVALSGIATFSHKRFSGAKRICKLGSWSWTDWL